MTMDLADFASSEKITNLLAAYNKFQGMDLVAIKKGTNPHYHSTFAKLPDIIELVRAPMTEVGLSVFQMPLGGVEVVRLLVRLSHSSGEYFQWIYSAPLAQKDIQKVCAAITYLRRTSLMAVLGIPDQDDDGNTAASVGYKASQTPPTGASNVITRHYDPPPPDDGPFQRPPQAPQSAPKTYSGGPSEKQLKRLFALTKANGYETYQVDAYIAQTYKLSSKGTLSKIQYDTICNMLESRTLPLIKNETNGGGREYNTDMSQDEIPF